MLRKQNRNQKDLVLSVLLGYLNGYFNLFALVSNHLILGAPYRYYNLKQDTLIIKEYGVLLLPGHYLIIKKFTLLDYLKKKRFVNIIII